MSKPSTRTILALVTAAILVVVAVTAAVVAVAVHNSHESEPTITAYSHGTTVDVPPYRFWTVEPSDSTGRLELQRTPESESITTLTTPAGYPVQLSLPDHISKAPWMMVLEYAEPNGNVEQRLTSYLDYDEGTRAVTVPSHIDPDLRLVGIEVQLVIPTRDEAGNESFMPYQAWSISTARAAQ